MTTHATYIGSGPYCYANSLAMILGGREPSPSVIEFATCSPFGMQVIDGKVVFFDPYGWDPLAGLDGALNAAGWESDVIASNNGEDAVARLGEEVKKAPVLVGPLELGRLRYQPGMNGDIGADHYVVVLRINDSEVELHDPHGFPYATLPITDLMASWKCAHIAYGKPYMMRTNFRQIEHGITEEDIIRRSLPRARKWVSMKAVPEDNMPPGSLSNADAAEWLAKKLEANALPPDIRSSLIYFAVRVGARRLADASTCLARIKYNNAARVMAMQARLVGALQLPLVLVDNKKAATLLRDLAPTYEQLKVALGV